MVLSIFVFCKPLYACFVVMVGFALAQLKGKYVSWYYGCAFNTINMRRSLNYSEISVASEQTANARYVMR